MLLQELRKQLLHQLNLKNMFSFQVLYCILMCKLYQISNLSSLADLLKSFLQSGKLTQLQDPYRQRKLEWKQILEGILETINKINTYRIDEGLSLKTDFELRITNIENLLEETIAMDPDRMKLIKEKLQKAIQDLNTKVDENRFEQELIYYMEKLDITEEKVRLKNHLDYFKKAFPYWIVSLIGIIIVYFIFRQKQIFYAIFFSFIAAITFPHTIVINKMFKQKKRHHF